MNFVTLLKNLLATAAGFTLGWIVIAHPVIAATFAQTAVTWAATTCQGGEWDITATATSLTDGRQFETILSSVMLPQFSITMFFPNLPPGWYTVSAVSRRTFDGLTAMSSLQARMGLGDPPPPPPPPRAAPAPVPTPTSTPTPPPGEPGPEPAPPEKSSPVEPQAITAAPTVSIEPARFARGRSTCDVTVTATPPDAPGRWRARFVVDGESFDADSSAPYQAATSVQSGPHEFFLIWTKAGRGGIPSPVTVAECR